jgi:hypothetical protein
MSAANSYTLPQAASGGLKRPFSIGWKRASMKKKKKKPIHETKTEAGGVIHEEANKETA